MAFAENLAPFFELKDFGEIAVWSNEASPVPALHTFNCIFNSPEETIQIYDRSFYDQKFYSADVSVNQISLECKTTDVAGMRVNQPITIRSTMYYIMFVNSNMLGTSLIHLSLDTTN